MEKPKQRTTERPRKSSQPEANKPPVIRQNQITPNDIRRLRKFFKHCTTEQLRQYIVKLIDDNKSYTEQQVQKTRIEMYKDCARDTKEALMPFRAYCNLPWYKRMFARPPR